VSGSTLSLFPYVTPIGRGIAQQVVGRTTKANRRRFKTVKPEGFGDILTVELAVDYATTVIEVSRCKTSMTKAMIKLQILEQQ
jgi:hypothetical protein